MISICITFCDKNFSFVEAKLKEINDKIKVDHEVILIDAREELKDVETSFKPDFAFDYNSGKLAARIKALSFAKGDYVWFIDVQDSLSNLDSFYFTEDIISYGRYDEKGRIVNTKEKVITDNIFDNYVLYEMTDILENKIIKKSLFDNVNNIFGNEIPFVSCNVNDVLLTFVINEAKSIRVCSKALVYHKYISIDISDDKKLNDLFTGQDYIIKTAKYIIGENESAQECFIRKSLRDFSVILTQIYYKYGIDSFDTITHLIDVLVEAYGNNVIKEYFILLGINRNFFFKKVGNYVRDKYGISIFPRYEIWSFNEKTQEYESEAHEDYEITSSWNHSVSIVGIVYEGNLQYLESFVKSIKKNIGFEKQIVIVDNRESDTSSLPELEGVEYVKANYNHGVLATRRTGFEKAKNEYVWFVDIDDGVFALPVKDYGFTDLICFSYVNDGDKVTLTNLPTNSAKSISDSFVWNKFIRRTVLSKAYESLSKLNCYCAGDDLLMYSVYKLCESCSMYPEMLYNHTDSENSLTLDKINSQDKIDKIFLNLKDALVLLKDIVPDWDSFIITKCKFYLELFNVVDESLINSFVKSLFESFDEKTIKSTLNAYSGNYYLTAATEYFLKKFNKGETCNNTNQAILCLDGSDIKFYKCFSNTNVVETIPMSEFNSDNKKDILFNACKMTSQVNKNFILRSNSICGKCNVCVHSNSTLKRLVIQNKVDSEITDSIILNTFNLMSKLNSLGLEELVLDNFDVVSLNKDMLINFIKASATDFKAITIRTNKAVDSEIISALTGIENVKFLIVSDVSNNFGKDISDNIKELAHSNLFKEAEVVIVKDDLDKLNDATKVWQDLCLEDVTYLLGGYSCDSKAVSEITSSDYFKCFIVNNQKAKYFIPDPLINGAY